MKKLMMIALAAAMVGCATKTRNVEMDGLFVQADSATLALGSVDVMATPQGEEAAIVKYAEDTAWLATFRDNPVKTHFIRIQLTGTNSTAQVAPIVENICKAFVPTAAIVNGVGKKGEDSAAAESSGSTVTSGDTVTGGTVTGQDGESGVNQN